MNTLITHTVLKWNIALMATFTLLLLPVFTQAETVVRGGDSVSVSASQLVENDFYAYGGTITHSGVIESDMYAVGGSVVVNGLVGSDLTVISGSTQIHSTVGDDVRLITGEAVVADTVQGDLFVIGGILNVLSSAEIKGNVYFYGGQANIDGVVIGSVMGGAERFNINSEVGGDVDVKGSVTLDDQASIGGDIRYESIQELSRAQNAVVEGTVSRSAGATTNDSASGLPIATFLIWSFTALAIYLFLRGQMGEFVQPLRKDLPRAALFGLVGILFLPVLSVILLVTVLGVWFGVLTILVWLGLLLTSMMLLPIFLGDQIQHFFKPNKTLTWPTVLLGVAAAVVFMYIPLIGCLLIFLGVMVVFGYLLLRLYRLVKDVI